MSLNPLDGPTSLPFMLWARRSSEAPQQQIRIYLLNRTPEEALKQHNIEQDTKKGEGGQSSHHN
jgi:hypothetical protein